MTINSKFFVAALMLAAPIMPATAQNFYAALDHGTSRMSSFCSNSSCDNSDTIFRVTGGYQATPMWGMELSYGDYGKASAGPSIDWEVSGLQLSGTGTFPVMDGFSLLGRLGISHTQFELYGASGTTTVNNTKLAYGIGAQYDYSSSVDIRAQYDNLGKIGDASTTGTSKVTLLSIGIVLKF